LFPIRHTPTITEFQMLSQTDWPVSAVDNLEWWPVTITRSAPQFSSAAAWKGAPSTHSGPVPPLPLSLPANISAAPARGSRQSPDGSASPHLPKGPAAAAAPRRRPRHSRHARRDGRGTPRRGDHRRPHPGRFLGADRRPARVSRSLRTLRRMLGPAVTERDRRPRKRPSTPHPHRPEPHRQARTWTGKH